jgi:hypothetical protein
MMNKHILTVMVALAIIIGYNTIIVSNYVHSFMNTGRKYIMYSTLPNTSLFARSW